jgi:cell division protein ZapE
LSGVPCMGPRQASEARRFTWLIDVMYDHNVKMIMSAECEPEALYTVGPLANEFQRTISRIEEMQTKTYLDRERRRTVSL